VNRSQRLGLLDGLATCAAAATPFAFLWILPVTSAHDPLTVRAVLELAIAIAVLGTPAMLAAWLLWRA
jgi:hypothetical protein